MNTSIGFLNIRGLTSKLDEIKIILSNHKFDIFCLAETFLDVDDSDSFYTIPGFCIVRRDRPSSNGGGLLVYVNNSLQFKNLDILCDDSLEILSLKIMPKYEKNFALSVVYRPPNSVSEWYGCYTDYLHRLFALGHEVISVGDFNVNLMDASKSKNWLDILSPFSMKQLINKPTRVTETTSTLIDHLYASHPANITRSGIIEYSLSDHYLVFADRSKSKKDKQYNRCLMSFLDYSQLTDERISSCFANVNFDHVLCQRNVDVMFDEFYKLFHSVTSGLVTTKRRYVKTFDLPKWLDSEVRVNMKRRDFLKSSGSWEAYKRQRNFVTNLIRKKKKRIISEILKSTNSNTKLLWRALNVKPFSDRSSLNSSSLSPDDFNTHFSSIADRITRDISSANNSGSAYSDRPLTCMQMENIPPFTPQICSKYLDGISVHKATGPDRISVRMLKMTWPFICPIVTDMFNRLLLDGKIPSSWKIARVSPIHKDGDINEPSNYRPISILPVISKIFEKHVNYHLTTFLIENKLLHNMQCGFRKGYSCVDSVHKLFSDCLRAKSYGRFVSLIFLDFKKAFDCVNHDILTRKLLQFGICGNTFDLLTSFLRDRQQFVSVNGVNSGLCSVNIGVPQGSILAPTLFLIYINDLLSRTVYSSSFAYADDTVFLATSLDSRSLEFKCNQDLHLINLWCTENRMVINVKNLTFCFIDLSVVFLRMTLNFLLMAPLCVSVLHLRYWVLF